MKKKIIVVSNVDPTAAYSGLVYLCEELYLKNQKNLTLLCRIDKSRVEYAKNWNFNYVNINSFIMGRIPYVRNLYFKLKIFLYFLLGDCIFVFHELFHFDILLLIKKLSPSTVCIHYATELYEERDVPAHKKILQSYEENASVPDMVIECDKMRTNYRRERYNIKSPIVTIENTLPTVALNNIKKYDFIESRICRNNKDSLKLVVYSGAGFLHRELNKVIDEVALIKGKCHFVLACYGPENEIEQVIDYANKSIGIGKFTFFKNLSREQVYFLLSLSDFGIVYYDPSLSIGNKYASPTKFFEYVAMGLGVVSTNNESLINIINKFEIGSYIDPSKGISLSNAIECLLNSNEQNNVRKERIKSIFTHNLSYEVLSKNAIGKIMELVDR